MKKLSFLSLLFILGIFYSSVVKAATYTAVADGNWSTPSTWDLNAVPGTNDTVIIDGYSVVIDGLTTTDAGNIEIQELRLTNANNLLTGGSSLSISSNVVFIVSGNLIMTSTANSKMVSLEANNISCMVQIEGNIMMSALDESQVFIDLNGGSGLAIKGNFVRPSNYGALYMASNCTLTYNGSGSQSLVGESLAGAKSDVFQITNLILDNETGFTLTDTLFINNNLDLTKGVINSTDAAPVVFGDYATMTGGSTASHVDGPVVKKGRSTGPFMFPIGDLGVYSPMTLSTLTDLASQFSAEYRGDPPPWGSNASNVTHVDETQHWILKQTEESEDVTMNLGWKDGATSGLTDIDSVIVVGLSTSNIWEYYGQSAVTGGVGAGVSGTVTSLEGDPPPWGVSQYTIGSGSPPAVLPVELTKFFAEKRTGGIYLEWKTASELNASHYSIERSNDGSNFIEIESIKINGDTETSKQYNTMDKDPQAGQNYYRIKIVDKDGTYEYSSVEVANFNPKPVFIMAPNPVKDVLFIEGSNTGEIESEIEVFDRSGTRLFHGTYLFQDGSMQLSTDELNVKMPGTYFLRISGNAATKVMKFMKVN